MAAIRHLSRAPITEALFDFRVTLPPEFQAEAFNTIRERIRERYPVVEEMRRFEARFEFQADKGPISTQSESGGLIGFRFRSEDGKDFAQFRRDGFTFNRLPEYTSWDQLCPEALRLWAFFVELAKPEKLDRLGVRYINSLKLPPQLRLQDVVEVIPPSFAGAPELLSSFLISESRHDPQTGYMVNIVEALQPNLAAEGATLILDIDLSKVAGLALDEARLRPALEEMHRLKNEIFFSAITERSAKEYE
jgi:uncharacterized protein (TIGR04255 family)